MSDIIAFSEYMFIKNTYNRPIQLNLQGIENNKDLFLFLIDLFCKGLVICYGTNNSVNFDDLDLPKFQHIKSKMANAGIIIDMEITNSPIEIPTSINSEELEAEEDHKELKEYTFKIFKGLHIYNIKFCITRVTS